MYSRSFISTARISSYLEAMRIAASPTSCKRFLKDKKINKVKNNKISKKENYLTTLVVLK
jgi:gamma-glutamylcysteine synthetase